ncbi:hypothetical protein D3C78_1188930 [compost metagenome]
MQIGQETIDAAFNQRRAFGSEERERLGQRIDDEKHHRRHEARQDKRNAETGNAVGAEFFSGDAEDHADYDGHHHRNEDERQFVDDRHQHDEEDADHRPGDDHIQRFAAKRLLAARIVTAWGGSRYFQRVRSCCRNASGGGAGVCPGADQAAGLLRPGIFIHRTVPQ